MMMITPGSLTFVMDNRLVNIEVETLDSRNVVVHVRRSDHRAWTFEEPAWRSLGLGIVDDRLYWWSARRMVVLPKDDTEEVKSLDVDEDILCVWPLSDAWLIICETSARLADFEGEGSRLDFPDVVSDFHWNGGQLMVQVEGYPAATLFIDGKRLSWS